MPQKLRKITIGLRSEQRLFRVIGIGGFIVDSILDLRGTKAIEKDYFQHVIVAEGKDIYEIFNNDKGNSCKITTDSFIISKSVIEDEKRIDINKFVKQASVIYETVMKGLDIRELNRIGIVYEYETGIENCENVNGFLYENLLHYDHQGIPSNFGLKFAFKMPTDKSTARLAKTEVLRDYYNVITQFTVKLDEAKEPVEDCLCISADVQRYFYPPTKATKTSLIQTHYDYSNKYINGFIEKIKERGINLGKEKKG